jgi:catechol 2,3-dioxygenase-like lactoylglutathione lyase family enzyme
VITRIHSATVLVRDQDAALDFYVNKLGFEKLSDDAYGENSRWVTVAPPGAATALALTRPEDMGMDPGVEFGGRGIGISLIADDIDATYQQLSERGVQFTAPPERMPWGSKATWFSDPDGNSFFLSEEG